MRILTLNKQDWTGGEIKVRIKKDGTFQVFDYNFKLTITDFGGDAGQIFKVTGEGWGDEPIVKGYLMNDGEWTALSDAGLQRESTDPFAAAIQVLCNII